LADPLQVLDQAADLGVGVLEEAGVDFLGSGEEAALVGAQLVPGQDALVAGGQRGVRRDDAELLLAGEALRAGDVPAAVVAAAVALDVLGRDVVGPVGGPEGQASWRGRARR
jgi:hypothetical protein